MVKVKKNRVGERFGRLKVISQAEDYVSKVGKHYTKWRCECDCGTITEVTGSMLVTGGTTSCGCYMKEQLREKQFKHGKIESLAYSSWADMLQRVGNKNSSSYFNYGERGIKVCDRWSDKENGFINFLADMGDRPSKEYSIDRIDNGGNYEPDNCRWATRTEQANNRRNTLKISMDNTEYTIRELSDMYGISMNLLRERIFRNAWDIKKALSTPPRKSKPSEKQSKIKGVTWIKERQRWRAAIFKDGRSNHIGYFKKREDAEKAVTDKVKNLG